MHADALTVEQTDWPQIVTLYDQLLGVVPTPVVALNRAIAIGELQGPAAALALVDELDLDNYHPSTPPEPICFAGWADTARPRPPTSAPPPWRRPMPSEPFSGPVAEPHADQPMARARGRPDPRSRTV